MTATQDQSQATTNQAPAAATAGGQAQSPDQAFSRIIEQQIQQAIRPVLDEFRQQMAQALEQQTTAGPAAQAGGQDAVIEGVQRATQTLQKQAPPQPAAETQGSLGQAAQQLETQQPQATKTAEAATQAVAAPAETAQSTVQTTVRAVEQHVEPWLQSMLVAGLAALLSETTHAAVQRQAENGLHTLLQKLFDVAPEGTYTPDMREKTERLLQAILAEALDAVFTQAMRVTVERGGQQALQETFKGDFGAALNSVLALARAMAEALVAVIRRNQQNLIRLAIALALFAFAGTFTRARTTTESTESKEA